MEALWAELDTADARRGDPARAVRAGRDRPAAAHRRHAPRHLARRDEPGELVDLLQPGLAKLDAMVGDLLRPEARAETGGLRGAARRRWARRRSIADRIVRLFEMNGAVGLAALGPQARRRRGRADPRLYQARRGAGARLGAERGQRLPGARPVGAAAHRRPRPRFRATPARIPRAAQERPIPRPRSTNGSPIRARASTSSAAPSSAPAPPRHHRPDARPDRDPGAGAAGALSRRPTRRAAVMISSRWPSGSSK